MKINGTVFAFGDNIDTDMIIAARYLTTADPKILATHFMEDIDKSLASKIAIGDILVAGKNYGCGSSREHAPLAIKGLGVSCVIAESFARIFYRNALNIGLPIIECAVAAKDIETGDRIAIDFDEGIIVNKTQNKQYHTEPYPAFIQKVIGAGGLVGYAKGEVLNEL